MWDDAPELIAALREDRFGHVLEAPGAADSDPEQDEAVVAVDGEPPF